MLILALLSYAAAPRLALSSRSLGCPHILRLESDWQQIGSGLNDIASACEFSKFRVLEPYVKRAVSWSPLYSNFTHAAMTGDPPLSFYFEELGEPCLVPAEFERSCCLGGFEEYTLRDDRGAAVKEGQIENTASRFSFASFEHEQPCVSIRKWRGIGFLDHESEPDVRARPQFRLRRSFVDSVKAAIVAQDGRFDTEFGAVALRTERYCNALKGGTFARDHCHYLQSIVEPLVEAASRAGQRPVALASDISAQGSAAVYCRDCWEPLVKRLVSRYDILPTEVCVLVGATGAACALAEMTVLSFAAERFRTRASSLHRFTGEFREFGWMRYHHPVMTDAVPHVFLPNLTAPCWRRVESSAVRCLPSVYAVGPVRSSIHPGHGRAESDASEYFWNEEALVNRHSSNASRRSSRFRLPTVDAAAADSEVILDAPLMFTGGLDPLTARVMYAQTLPALVAAATPAVKIIVTFCKPSRRYLIQTLPHLRLVNGTNFLGEVSLLEHVTEDIRGMQACVTSRFARGPRGNVGDPASLVPWAGCAYLPTRASPSPQNLYGGGGPSWLGVGMYGAFLLEWLRHFKAEQILVIHRESGDDNCAGNFLGDPRIVPSKITMDELVNYDLRREREALDAFYGPYESHFWTVVRIRGVRTC